jgi:hypothetical protein
MRTLQPNCHAGDSNEASRQDQLQHAHLARHRRSWRSHISSPRSFRPTCNKASALQSCRPVRTHPCSKRLGVDHEDLRDHGIHSPVGLTIIPAVQPSHPRPTADDATCCALSHPFPRDEPTANRVSSHRRTHLHHGRDERIVTCPTPAGPTPGIERRPPRCDDDCGTTVHS